MTAIHEVVGGKVQVYRRDRSPYWWCSASVGGGRHRTSTKKESLAEAKEFAQDWFLNLKGVDRWGGGLKPAKAEKTFRLAAEKFLDEFEVITEGQRSPIYVKGHRHRIERHLVPFFGDTPLSEVTSGLIQEYRIHRIKTGRLPWPTKSRDGGEAGAVPDHTRRPLSRGALHQEIVCLRQILKTGLRHRWIDHLPDMSEPYRKAPKVSHRAWFSLEEYNALCKALRDRCEKPPRPRWQAAYENLRDYVLIMANTGLRPDEILRLEYRDVAIVTDRAMGERILEIEVRGKRGTGYCKSMPNAVFPFTRLRKRNRGQPTDRLFPTFQRELFNTILDELNLKADREGSPRTAYSLRHTYICMRLMEGADIYQIAKNCRTSVEMIENYYASHIKNTLDAAAINVRKPKPTRKVSRKSKRKNEE
jgi:integrase